MILTIKTFVEGGGNEKLDVHSLCITLGNFVGTVSKEFAGLYLD
jgi:hypothetical protein